MKTLVLAVVVLAAGCAKEGAPSGKAAGAAPAGGKGPQAFPVELAPVSTRRVEYAVHAVGSVEAFEHVQVTARVSGVVEKVRFLEGETVKKDAVLVEIDPDRYRIALTQAKATLQRAEAVLADATVALERREALEKKSPGLVPEEDRQTFRTRRDTAAAELAQAKAALELADLNLRDAFVRAPAAGVMQTRSVQTGQYVQPGTVLGSLLRRDPLLLTFKVPEPDAARLAPGLTAYAKLRGTEQVAAAQIIHVADAAEGSARMVQVVAKIDAQSAAGLRPGAFAEVKVPVGGAEAAPVVPETAIRPSEKGFLAFVVEGGLAHERVLTLGMRTDEGLVEVRAGLKPGEQLVVRGAEGLREGAPVKVDAPRQAGGERSEDGAVKERGKGAP